MIMSEPKSSAKSRLLIEDVIGVQDIVLEYIINNRWKDYCKFGRKLTEKIVEVQPKSKESFEKLINDFNNPFFVYNEITKPQFTAQFPFKELLRQAVVPRQICVSNSGKRIKTNRQTLSKKVRLLILERDGYRCCFCGKTAKESKLEVDHIVPVAKGGTDSINNLHTLCFDCNRGKSDLRV
jgi:hypothetical protein